MSLLSMIKGRGPSGFGYASTAEEVTEGLDLRGKTILVTGINAGLGQESARVLAMRGARILGAARTRDKARAACEGLPGEAVALACELSDPASVRACVQAAAEHAPIDVILCNAAIMAPRERTLAHGQELQFLTNHVGHFMLVTGLLPHLREDARVVIVSSRAHRRAPATGIHFDDLTLESAYDPMVAYGHSKLANLLFARALARRFRGTARTANALHPGVIATGLWRNLPAITHVVTPILGALALKTIPQGAATQCWAATHPSLREVSGEYFSDSNVAASTRHGSDEAMAERLWTVTEELVARL
jgi:NAD(P)-dependent dehydrogenase (short-subunit alcohol dehydrogenase family)